MESLRTAPTVEEFVARVRAAHTWQCGAGSTDLPDEIEAEARRAEEERHIGRALELWALLTDLDPWHAPWWHERGMTALRDGQTKWARVFLRRASAIDPDYWPTRQVLATLPRVPEPAVRRAPLCGVIRSACVSVARGDVESATRDLADDLRSRNAEEIAATIMTKLCSDARW